MSEKSREVKKFQDTVISSFAVLFDPLLISEKSAAYQQCGASYGQYTDIFCHKMSVSFRRLQINAHSKFVW